MLTCGIFDRSGEFVVKVPSYEKTDPHPALLLLPRGLYAVIRSGSCSAHRRPNSRAHFDADADAHVHANANAYAYAGTYPHADTGAGVGERGAFPL